MVYKSILLIGVGALGSAFLQNSIGMFDKVGIFDGDVVAKSNLSTQPFYADCDPSFPVSKAGFAADKMRGIDKNTEYIPYEKYFTDEDFEIFSQYDVIADFTDNLRSRLVINDGCTKRGKPAIFSSLNDRELSIFFYGEDSACFNCIFRNSIGKAKEGCEAMLSLPGKNAMSFMMEKISLFLSGGLRQGSFCAFNLSNGNEIQTETMKDLECETCSLHSFKLERDGFIQVCSSGIKFSLHKQIPLYGLKDKLNGSRLIDNYLLYGKNGMSVLVSENGDFLFTNYSRKQAEELLASLFP